MSKHLPPEPSVSPNFTLEDIRKVRDYHHELYKVLTWDEQQKRREESYRRAMSRIEAIKAKGIKPTYPKRIEV
jgi:hypothetical protein